MIKCVHLRVDANARVYSILVLHCWVRVFANVLVWVEWSEVKSTRLDSTRKWTHLIRSLRSLNRTDQRLTFTFLVSSGLLSARPPALQIAAHHSQQGALLRVRRGSCSLHCALRALRRVLPPLQLPEARGLHTSPNHSALLLLSSALFVSAAVLRHRTAPPSRLLLIANECPPVFLECWVLQSSLNTRDRSDASAYG